jgi:hypothetical protein
MEMSSNSSQKGSKKREKKNVLSPSIGGGFVLGTSVWVVKEIILCNGQLVKKKIHKRCFYALFKLDVLFFFDTLVFLFFVFLFFLAFDICVV